MPKIKDIESSFEAKVLGDKYGINMWEVTLGIVPWLKVCKDAGIMTEEDIGMPLELDRGEFWSALFHRIAYRLGVGDVLAEGTPRAADILGKGHEYLTHCAHGFVEHWLGRGVQSALTFPYWILAGLIWVTDSRDPFGDTHDVFRLGYMGSLGTPYLSQKQTKAKSKKLYGSEKTCDPTYEYKAPRAMWHQNRACVKEMLVMCESIFPIIVSPKTKGGFGDTSVESALLSAVTGRQMSEDELDKIGERVFNLERAIMRREGRSRKYDVECGVLQYMEKRPDTDGITLDIEKFLRSLDEYYILRGWDVTTGWPQKEQLVALCLEDISEELEMDGVLP